MAPDTITLTYRRVANFRALHTSWITSLAFSPDGGVLASAGADGVIFFIDVPRRRPFCCLDFEHPQTATCLLWPSSDELIVGRSDGAVQMFKIDAEKKSAKMTQALDSIFSLPIRHMAYREGKTPLLAVAYMTKVKIYRAVQDKEHPGRSWKLVDKLIGSEADADLVTSVNFIRHKNVRLVVTHAQGGITIWRSKGDHERLPSNPIGNAHISKNSSFLASTNLNGGIDVTKVLPDGPWFALDQHYETPFNPRMNYELPIRFLSNITILSGSLNGLIYVWNIDSGKHTTVSTCRLVVRTLEVAGDTFATGSGDAGEPGVITLFSAEECPTIISAEEEREVLLIRASDLLDAFLKETTARVPLAPLKARRGCCEGRRILTLGGIGVAFLAVVILGICCKTLYCPEWRRLRNLEGLLPHAETGWWRRWWERGGGPSTAEVQNHVPLSNSAAVNLSLYA